MMGTRGATVLGLAVLLGTSTAAAQMPPASQHGTVSQTINTTLVSIEYDRPVARGRLLFGDSAVVMYGALWTPGANRATVLEVSRDIRIAGRLVPAGKYSVWTVPGRDEWTLILNRRWDTHHAIYPGEEDDVIRVRLEPAAGSHMETLAFYFPVVEAYRAVLHMHWGTVILAIPIDVDRA
jgi:hypothetical protein